MKKEKNLSSWKSFLMSLAATTVSIVLTFGTTAIINQKTKNAEKRQMVMMIMYDMRETLKEMEACNESLNEFFDLQVDLIAHPQRFQKGQIQLITDIPVFDYTTTTENIFKSNIETIKTIGNVLFVEASSSFYADRDHYKNKVIDDFNQQVGEALKNYEALAGFDSANYPFYSQSILRRMREEYEQCKLMMKVTDEELESFSAAQQKLQEASKQIVSAGNQDDLVVEMQQRRAKLYQAREEGRKADSI